MLGRVEHTSKCRCSPRIRVRQVFLVGHRKDQSLVDHMDKLEVMDLETVTPDRSVQTCRVSLL
jgi:hypothetical protein